MAKGEGYGCPAVMAPDRNMKGAIPLGKEFGM